MEGITEDIEGSIICNANYLWLNDVSGKKGSHSVEE